MSTIKILISGPSGAGKSTLAQEILAQLKLKTIGQGIEATKVLVFSTNHELDETQDGLELYEEGRVRLRGAGFP
jgi:cytidylate kinase